LYIYTKLEGSAWFRVTSAKDIIPKDVIPKNAIPVTEVTVQYRKRQK